MTTAWPKTWVPGVLRAEPCAEAPEDVPASIVDDVFEVFGTPAGLFRADGSLIRATPDAGDWPGPDKPTIAESLDAAAPRWFEAEGRIYLVSPLRRRRRPTGYLVARYLPDDGVGDGCSGFRRSNAAVLARAVHHHVQMRLTAARQAADLDEMGAKLLESYEEISLLYRLGQQFNVTQRPSEILALACQEFQRVLGRRRSVYGLTREPAAASSARTTFHAEGELQLSRTEALELWSEYERRGLPWGQPHVDNRRARATGAALCGVHRHLLAPLCYQGETLGLFGAVADDQAPEFDSRDAQLLANVATQIGAHWQNFLLFDEMRQLLLDLVRALVSAIDTKDPYTHGHSERVATIATSLAQELGLGDQEVEDGYLAGLLHDVGKIGIREEVLKKPGRLTDAEWAHLREHPGMGARILRPIKAISRIVPAVEHHHESFDGRGYPAGLSGEQIPRLARIVAVADSFDAMSSDRPYRPALSLEQVSQTFQNGRGSQWDPDLVDCLLRLTGRPDFVEKHAAALSSGDAGIRRLEPTN